MAIRNLLLFIVIVGGLVIFALENASPVVPLVVLGSQTQAFPLWVWLVGAIAAGVLTTLLVAGLIQAAASSSRSRTSRFYSDRPRYRPPTADATFDDDDEDWQVIDLDRDRPSDSRSDRTAGTPRYASPQYTSTRYEEDELEDRNSSTAFTSTRPQSTPLENWDSFSVRRTDWDDWNRYEEAPVPNQRNDHRGSEAGDRPSTYDTYDAEPSYRTAQYTSPETVIQDSADRDWQDWSDYGDEPVDDDQDDERYASSPVASFRPNQVSYDTPYASDDDYREDYEDDEQGAYDDYGDDGDDHDGEYRDIPYRDAPYRDVSYDNAETPINVENDEDYDEASGVGRSPYGYEAEGSPASSSDTAEGYYSDTAEGYYTDYVRYNEADDYYDDYDEYANFEEEYEAAQKAGSSKAESESADLENLDELDDWEEESDAGETSRSDQPPAGESDASERRIYEVQRQPTAVKQTGTLYSYSYRNSDMPSKEEPLSPVEREPEDDDKHLEGQSSDRPSAEEESGTGQRILTTPPPSDFMDSKNPDDASPSPKPSAE